MNETEHDALNGRLRSLERQLAQAARREIDIESESQDALAQAEEFRQTALLREQQLAAEVAQAKLDNDSLSRELEEAQSRADHMHTSSGSSDLALQQKDAEVQSVRETNRLLDGKLQQLQSQLQEQSKSTKQARETIMELTKERGNLDMKRMHGENELRQCQHARQNLELENDILQKDVASLQTQLADKGEALRQSWADANAQAHSMEQQLHDASSQQQALAASCKQLEQQRDRLNDQLQKEQKEKQDAHAQLQEQRARFEEEIASLHTLAGRHKEERASLEHDRQTLGGLVQELTRKAEAFKAEQQQASAQLQQRLDAAEQACHERDQTIQRFKQALEENGDPALLQNHEPLANGSAAAAPPGAGQLSPVQFYSKYVSLVREHDKLKQEHSALQAEWEQFEQAVIPEAEKAQQLAKKNMDLDEANAKLSAQVQVSNEKAKRCADTTYKWQGQFDDEKSAHGVTRKLLKESQHQVVLLANENRQLNGVRERAVMPAWSNATLAANLVEFKDTQDLVAKNEALRRLAHELQLKAEQQLKQQAAEAHGREQQMMKSYEGSLAAARQQNAVAMEQMQHMMRQRDSAQQAAKTAAEAQKPASDPHQADSRQSHRVHELEKELGRLREDGHAYREDLRQQLETARQAATQARHDAAQAHAAARYEASRLQQLQDDKAVTDSMVASWKQQGREQQELISGLNRRLDQLHNQASRAQDDANQRRQRVAVLEAQSELLTKDNQRLLHESTDHAAARYRLEAERDTQRQLSSQQHDEDAKERGRLHSELSSLQGQLADSQKQLTEAQSDHKHSFSAQETADARLAKMQEARDQLQQDLSRQLATSEAKVASLQTLLDKSEHRAASLELQLKTRAASDSGPEASADGGSSSKAAESLQTIADLRKEVQEAQQQAAQEAGHVAQYKSLAQSAEENTSVVQEQVTNLKAEAAQLVEQLRQAKSKLEVAEKDLSTVRQSAYEDAQAAIKDQQQAHSTTTNLQAELVIAKRHASAAEERHQQVVADLATATSELKEARSSYNTSVLEHAETVKKLSEQEARVDRLQQEQAAHETAVQLAHRGKAAADLAWQQERSKLQAALQTAQQRLHDLERVNAQLQVHLDTHAQAAAGQAPDQGSQLAGLVQYLQKRLRTLEGENTSLEQLSSRLKSDLEAASKRATQADQARLETAEKLQNSLRSQADQQRLMEQVQENNLLRESNVTLRSMSEQNRKEKEAWSRRAQEAEAAGEPLKRHIRDLEAARDAHQQDIQSKEKEIQIGQRRIADLLHKQDAVDKVEHDRVVAENAANQNKLSTEQAEVKRLSAANSAAQDNLSRAEAKVSHLTTTLKSAQDSLISIQADVSRLRPLVDQAESLQSQVTLLQTEVTTKFNTIEKNKGQVRAAKGLMARMNPDGLKQSEWETDMNQKLQERSELQQTHAKLEADNAQLKTDLAAAQSDISRSTTAETSNQAQQQQQQAELAKLRSAEQALQLQHTALTLELKQKDGRLEALDKVKQQMEEQVSKMSAELVTVRAQLEGTSGTPQAGVTPPQEPAASTSSEQQLSTREATLQQAEAALRTQQHQLSQDKQVQQQHEQSVTATQQQLVEQQQQLTNREQQLQLQEAACSQKSVQLDEQKSKLQTQELSAAQAVQQQGKQQDTSDAQVQQLQKQVDEQEQVWKAKHTRLERVVAEMKTKLEQRGEMAKLAQCSAKAAHQVIAAVKERDQVMADQLAQAGLPVPEGIDTEAMYQAAKQQCLAAKARGPAAGAKPGKQVVPAAASKGGAKAVQSTAAVDGSTSGAAPAVTGGEGGEVEAVRLAALASMNKPAAAAPGPQASSTPGPSKPAGVTPMLRLRPTVAQQGGKRERDASPSAASTLEAQAGSEPPPAKRVRAPTPVADAPPAVDQEALPASAPAVPSQQSDVAAATADMVTDQQQPVENVDVSAPVQQQQPSVAEAAPAAAQEHVARVEVTQHDPDHVQVNIQLPTALVHTDEALQQAQPTLPASAPGGDTDQEAGGGDVDMAEAAADKKRGLEGAKPAAEGDEAEDGELPDAGDIAAPGSEAQGVQGPESSAAATVAGQTDGSDADGANATGRKPQKIIFNLPTPAPAAAPSEPAQPSAPVAQQRGGRAPTSGTRGGAQGRRGGTAAGRSLHNAARGGPNKGRGRGRQ